MKNTAITLDVTKLYGFNLNTDKSKIKISSAASAKIGQKVGDTPINRNTQIMNVSK